MKILLISLAMEKGKPTPIFPLGLGCIAAVVCEAGHDVKVLDLNSHYYWSPATVEQAIAEAHFDVVGISAMIPHFSDVQWLSKVIHQCHPKSKVILGGGLGGAASELVFQETDVDIIVDGEGERTIVELLAALESGDDWHTVSGIKYSSNGAIIQTSPRPWIQDLDVLPFPARDLFPLDFYLHTPDWLFEVPKADIITSRGCPYNCTFCYQGIFGRKYRSRSAESIFREIQVLQRDYRIKGIIFRDDTFVLDRKRVLALCERLIETDTKVWWTCNGRANLMDDEMLNIMKQAGCVSVTFGIETGDEQILNHIRKQITLEQVRQSVKAVRRKGMIVSGYMMIGFPQETRETVRRSVQLCVELGLTAEFSIATPIPGTQLYDEALQLGKIHDPKDLVRNWSNRRKKAAVNLSDLPDEELAALKHDAERKLTNEVLRRHWESIFQMYVLYGRVNGWFPLLRRFLRSALRILTINLPAYVKGS